MSSYKIFIVPNLPVIYWPAECTVVNNALEKY